MTSIVCMHSRSGSDGDLGAIHAARKLTSEVCH